MVPHCGWMILNSDSNAVVMALLIKNIKKLVQVEEAPVRFRAGKEMQHLPCLEDAFLLVEGEKISATISASRS